MSQTEQHVPAWDRLSPRTQQFERAVLDVATPDDLDGRVLNIDTGIMCALTMNGDRLRTRANRDGAAATQYVKEKHMRYPAEHVPRSTLVAFVLETGVRPSDGVVSLMRHWGSGQYNPQLQTALLWQQLSTHLQLGNAECLLSAVGFQ